ncbi:MAG: DUF4287 domain-containing protein [Deltaproteobacteria bacterium]|nr:DUF4287 domain-containing protein [Deltaproteobacteria bacterium]
MATSSNRPIAQKLGIKTGNRIAVLYSPKGYTSILARLPPHVSLTTRLAGEPFDVVQGFYEDERSLTGDLRRFRKAIHPWGKVWICWRKGNVTELNRDTIMSLCEKVALDSVGSCAIDDEWSGLSLMLPKNERQERYAVHPGLKMIASWKANLSKKTGRTADEWSALIRKGAPKNDRLCVEWLIEKYGLGTNTARFLAEIAFDKAKEHREPQRYLESAEKWVDEMYSGAKEPLRPIYEQLIKSAFSLGKDVTATPCKTIVPLRRRFVFAQVKPSANTRVDLGLALGKTRTSGRLIDTGGLAKGDRITHRIPITRLSEIDEEVKTWLRKAYELDQ